MASKLAFIWVFLLKKGNKMRALEFWGQFCWVTPTAEY